MTAGRDDIRVGVIGLGFMGATHLRAYQQAEHDGFRCRVVAVADRNELRLSGQNAAAGNLGAGAAERLFDPGAVRTYADPERLIADPDIDLVSICTHTDTHVPLAIAALRAGKHVLVEKPIALQSAEVRRLSAAAKESGRLCMPAMCMRFWPEWAWVRGRIVDGSLGAVRSASFQRLGSAPDWGGGFYADHARSGGALVDLHIHDADYVHWCFGRPDEVVSTGTPMHVTTIYRYRRGPAHVVAEGGQDLAPGSPFRMRMVIAFELATADFDLARERPLMVYHPGREPETPELPRGTGYDGEVRHLLQAIRAGRTNADLHATMDDAAQVAALLEAEQQSILTGKPISLA